MTLFKSGLTPAQRRRLDAGAERWAEPEWAIIDLNRLAAAQETVGRLSTYMGQRLGADHDFTLQIRRLRRDLKAIRADAAFVPDDHEVLDERS